MDGEVTATAAGSRHGRAVPCGHQSEHAGILIENLLRMLAYAKGGNVVCWIAPIA